MTKKTKLWWVTRNHNSSVYKLWSSKPTWEYYGDGSPRYWQAENFETIIMSSMGFESLTGIKMKGGKDSIMCVSGFTPRRVK